VSLPLGWIDDDGIGNGIGDGGGGGMSCGLRTGSLCCPGKRRSVYGDQGICSGGGKDCGEGGGGGGLRTGRLGYDCERRMPPLVFLKYFVLFLVLVYCVFRLLRFPKVRRLVIFYITKYKNNIYYFIFSCKRDL
jgi:hypothetical protein